jgi:hypothetical protein
MNPEKGIVRIMKFEFGPEGILEEFLIDYNSRRYSREDSTVDSKLTPIWD